LYSPKLIERGFGLCPSTELVSLIDDGVLADIALFVLAVRGV
jgi:hypothetical protein